MADHDSTNSQAIDELKQKLRRHLSDQNSPSINVYDKDGNQISAEKMLEILAELEKQQGKESYDVKFTNSSASPEKISSKDEARSSSSSTTSSSTASSTASSSASSSSFTSDNADTIDAVSAKNSANTSTIDSARDSDSASAYENPKSSFTKASQSENVEHAPSTIREPNFVFADNEATTNSSSQTNDDTKAYSSSSNGNAQSNNGQNSASYEQGAAGANGYSYYQGQQAHTQNTQSSDDKSGPIYSAQERLMIPTVGCFASVFRMFTIENISLRTRARRSEFVKAFIFFWIFYLATSLPIFIFGNIAPAINFEFFGRDSTVYHIFTVVFSLNIVRFVLLILLSCTWARRFKDLNFPPCLGFIVLFLYVAEYFIFLSANFLYSNMLVDLITFIGSFNFKCIEFGITLGLAILACRKGTIGPNKYGADPIEVAIYKIYLKNYNARHKQTASK